MGQPNRPFTLTAQDRTYTMRFKNSLEPILEIHPTIQLQLLYAFVRVASEENLTITDVAARCNTSVSVASRHMKMLGSHGHGLGLVTLVQGVLGDARQQHVVLTPAGVALIKAMFHAFKNGVPKRTSRLQRRSFPAPLYRELVQPYHSGPAEDTLDTVGIPAKTDAMSTGDNTNRIEPPE